MEKRVPASERTREALRDLIEGRLFTANGRLIFGIFAALAEFERELISELLNYVCIVSFHWLPPKSRHLFRCIIANDHDWAKSCVRGMQT